jgi:hypothetical protein
MAVLMLGDDFAVPAPDPGQDVTAPAVPGGHDEVSTSFLATLCGHVVEAERDSALVDQHNVRLLQAEVIEVALRRPPASQGIVWGELLTEHGVDNLGFAVSVDDRRHLPNVL